MKAFLLAAGLGTRLRPLTDSVPKCMLPVRGRPMLDIWLEALASAGVEEVLVNLHHLPQVVERHLQQRKGSPRVRTVLEPTLLGSAGTLRANKDWVRDEDMFLVCYADNLTDFDLQQLVKAHRDAQPLATLAVFRAPNPSACGIVEVAPDGRVVSFIEKPRDPRGDLANAGMYAFAPGVLREIVGPSPKDIGYDLLPRLVGRSHAVLVDAYFRDIGTPQSYHLAQEEWLGSETE